jgi:ATP-dependent helicase/nuclease subunit B
LGGPDPSVFTIPAGTSFLDRLAATVLDACAMSGDPFALADTMILLPTRRAARALGDAFLAASGRDALLMPSIRTLADLPFEDGMDPGDGLAGDLDAPVACDRLERLFWLAATIKARDSAAEWASDPVAVLAAARALADLLDRAELSASGPEGFDWPRLNGLVERRELAAHWEKSVDFLSIITTHWPAVLESRGQCDAGRAGRTRLERLAARWSQTPPDHPVIIAGSTGSVRASRELMSVVARLPKGAVVLPGLDQAMDEATWVQVLSDEQHPQSGLARTLQVMGVERSQVGVWPGCESADPMAQRRAVLNEALTPKEVTSDWPARIRELRAKSVDDTLQAGLSGLTLISADNEESEATIIALALRSVLEDPEGTAALVTPDQALARRVAAKLQRWDIAVNVSSGEPLALSATGMMLRLVTAWIEDSACPVRLLALLAHPLCGLGMDRTERATARDCLDRLVLRGPRTADSLADLIARARDMKGAVGPAVALLEALQAILDQSCTQTGLSDGECAAPLPDWLLLVIATAEALAADRSPDGTVLAGAGRLWAGPAGEAAALALTGLQTHSAILGPVPRAGLERLVSALLDGQVVRPIDTHPRLAILGPLEARLLAFDTIILSGLNEGVWPARLPHDPFLSPSMAGALGIDRPERRTGLAAHDFAQLAAQPRVLLTRSARQADAPAVESRWLWRLRTLAVGAGVTLETGGDLVRLADAIEPDRTFDPGRARPEPRPPVRHRNPGRIAVTQVETWVRDPYKFYARQLMRLFPLDPVDAPMGTGKRGEAWHLLAEDVTSWPVVTGAAALAEARVALEARMRAFGATGNAATLEAARSTTALQFVLAMEAGARDRGARALVEQQVEADFETALGPIRLRARVDRMEAAPDGTVTVIDYKTGTPPSRKEALAFYGPQLTLTGLIIRREAQIVRTVDGQPIQLKPAAPVSLQYVKLGREPKRSTLEGGKPPIDMDTLIARTDDRFHALCDRFARPGQAYLFQPLVKHRRKTRTFVDPYVHLARADEWGEALGTEPE